MRPKERIKPFLVKVDLKRLLTKIWKITDEENVDHYITKINNNIEELTEQWLTYSDWRFSQLLVNNGYIPNKSGLWYYDEEYDILEALGYDKAECYYWGINFDKDNNELPETIYKPINELETDHLNAILDGGFVDRNPMYMKIMRNELNKRG